jgi:hypothetical protein
MRLLKAQMSFTRLCWREFERPACDFADPKGSHELESGQPVQVARVPFPEGWIFRVLSHDGSAVVVDQPLAGGHMTLPIITKSTMPAFSRALAMEYVCEGIRANTISPGVVDTPMHAHRDHEALKKLSPIPRLVQVSEIVDALFYLQSAPMVNGENIRIDGGSHAGAKW